MTCVTLQAKDCLVVGSKVIVCVCPSPRRKGLTTKTRPTSFLVSWLVGGVAKRTHLNIMKGRQENKEEDVT